MKGFNPYRFYRLDFCLRNLGLVVIAVLTVDGEPHLWSVLVAFLQVLLAQMYSFSMNDYYDFKAWAEDNHTGALVRAGVSTRVTLGLASLPLILLLATWPLSGWSFLLLVLYEVLFYIYQASSIRFKNHYLLSILLNAACLGTILYLYPFMFLTGNRITPIAAILSVVFFFYLAFHEIVHQIAHMGRDHIKALPAARGMGAAVWAAVGCLLVAMLVAAAGLVLAPGRHLFLTGVILFSAVRIWRVLRAPREQSVFLGFRESWHKLYTIPEGAYFCAFLLAERWK